MHHCDQLKKKNNLQLGSLLHIPIYATQTSSISLHFSYLLILCNFVYHEHICAISFFFFFLNHSAAGKEMIHLIILFCGSSKMDIK